DASSGWLLAHLHLPSLPHSIGVPTVSVLLSGLAIFMAAKKTGTSHSFGKEPDIYRSRFSILRDYQAEQRFSHFFLAPFQTLAVALKKTEIYLVDALVNGVGLLLVKISEISGWVDRKIIDGGV